MDSVMNLVFESLSFANENMIFVTLSSFSSKSQKLSLKRTELASSLNSFFLFLCTFLWNLSGLVERVNARRKSTFYWNVN
jgi:hypothetical protein